MKSFGDRNATTTHTLCDGEREADSSDGWPASDLTDSPLLIAAIQRTRDWLLARQHPDGYWCGELQGDTILESEYILLLAWLGREDSPIARQAARYILQQQESHGGWAQYPGGAIDISGSVKAYFALKLTGHDPESPEMRRAREAILAHGGADAVNSFTRFYLALLGQISYDHCPAVPPEAMLLPAWFPLSIYRISAWSRTILVPLSIMWAHRPTHRLPSEKSIQELFIKPPEDWPPLRSPGLANGDGWLTWERLFRGLDKTLKICERWRIRPLRRIALRAAQRWMLDRFADSDGLGAIFPPIIWSVIALKCLGYRDDSPEVAECLNQLDALTIEEGDTVRLQPCKSPVWDTAIAVRALAAAGVANNDEPLRKAAAWLLDKEVTRRGDWAQNVRAEPGGWYFEHRNDFYPDVDDTIMVLMALRTQVSNATCRTGFQARPFVKPMRTGLEARPTDNRSALEADSVGIRAACERGRRWILAMQNRDGGWGAFDKDNDSEFLCHVPFADHNAMIDPSTPDIAGRVIESLADWETTIGHPAVDRAIRYIRRTQEADGSWFGRWGVNYIYGTWQVLVGLARAGIPHDDPAVRRGVAWLLAHQQSSGGWGESIASYTDPAQRGKGPATASQTAWALLGLIAAHQAAHPAVRRGIQYLLDTQQPDGSWDEPEFTGTGFPLVFYLRYHLYPVYFPLLALSQWNCASQLVQTFAAPN